MDQEELTLFRDMARRAMEQEIAPHFEKWEEEHTVPRETWNTLGAAGLLCPDMPEEYGAAGADPQVTFAILEEMARLGFGGIATGYSIHSNIVAPYINNFGTEEQKTQWLPGMVSGSVLVSVVLGLQTIGPALLTALKSQDQFLAGFILMFVALLTLIGTMISDMLLVLLDPRIRYGARGS